MEDRKELGEHVLFSRIKSFLSNIIVSDTIIKIILHCSMSGGCQKNLSLTNVEDV